MLRFPKCFGNTVVFIRRTILLFQCLFQESCERKRVTEISFRRKLKKTHTSAISAEALFDDNSNKDALNVNNVLSATIEKN